MNIAAYKRTIADTEAPRQIERRVLSQATAALERSQAGFDTAERKIDKLSILSNGLRDSLWRNNQIWLTLKADLVEPDNQLPPELRAGLLSLAIWVERHTAGVMSGDLKVKPLIDINRSIIRGLSNQATNPEE